MTPDQIKTMQRNLGVAADGIAGPGTYTALFAKLGAKAGMARQLGVAAAVCFPRFSISDAPRRLAGFLGQTALESGGYIYMAEIWGPTEAQRGYEGRADLGNTQPGDGRRFAGGGILQVTGRKNFRAIGEQMGLDLEANPELLQIPGIGLLAACHWWQNNRANAVADTGNWPALSRLVNRGSASTTKPANHEAERLSWTARALKLVA